MRTMNQVGGDRRGYVHEGFGAGRHGCGGGQMTAMKNIWEQVNRAEDQPEDVPNPRRGDPVEEEARVELQEGV